jgi:hypothetical protein
MCEPYELDNFSLTSVMKKSLRLYDLSLASLTHLTSSFLTSSPAKTLYPDHLWVDGTHTAASEQSEAGNLRVKPVDILINPNLPQGSLTSLLIKNEPIIIYILCSQILGNLS